MSFQELAAFLWSVADLLRGDYKQADYGKVILPFTLLRRLDCVLEPTKHRVLDVNAQLKGKLENLDPQLRRASGFAFYNTVKPWSTYLTGQIFAIFIITVAAAEAAVALAMIISIYRKRNTVDVGEINMMKW